MTDKEYQRLLDLIEKGVRADERVGIIEEVSIHLLEAGYTYDSNMGIGDNIGSALLKEYANGYKKGEQDGRADAIRKFAEWLENNNFCFVEWKPKEKYSVNRSIETVLAMYEKEQK